MQALAFLALLLTAIALVPGGAHLASLPNKMRMERDAYFVAQQVYAGWQLFGVPLIGAVLANLGLAIVLRGARPARTLAFAAALTLAASLAVFFAWTFPANQATANWTTIPANWEALRRQWELAHAAGALLTLLAFVCAALAVLSAAPPRSQVRRNGAPRI